MFIQPSVWTMEQVGMAKEGKPLTQDAVSMSGHPTGPQEHMDRHLSSSSWDLGSPGSSPLCSDVWLHDPGTQASALSALQSKLKTLLEREVVQKKRSNQNLHQKGACRSRARSGAWGSSSSDEEVEGRVHVFTSSPAEGEHRVMPPDEGDLHPATVSALRALPRALGEGMENTEADDMRSAELEASSTCEVPWVSPDVFWRVARPEVRLLNGDIPRGEESPASGLVPNKWEEHPASGRSYRSQGHACSESRPGGASGGSLRRAESLESVSSSSSSLSLAERVEMNRSVLRYMLQKTHSKGPEGHQNPLTNQTLDNTQSKGGLNGTDGYSGISVHDGEQHQRSSVSVDELALTPRRQQTKRLVERAHMKGRLHPLKADHTILPVQSDRPVLLSRVGAPVAWRTGAAVGASGLGSGNLSDSSSSDSTCSGRRRPGHSPTRVRFQDESEKDAEVRYQERLHQGRRAPERAQGPLGSKPSLAAYVNSRTEVGRAGEAEPAVKHDHGNGDSAPLPQGNVGRQCESCGTILGGGRLVPNVAPFPPTAANGEVEGRVVPCWLAPTLPNRLVRTERIRETYVGSLDGRVVVSDGVRSRATDTGGTVTRRLAETRDWQRRKTRTREGSLERVNAAPNRPGGLVSPCSNREEPSQGETYLSDGTGALPPNPYGPDPADKSLFISKTCVVSTAPPEGAPLSPQLPQPLPPPLQSRRSSLKPISVDCPGPRGINLTPSPHNNLKHREPPEAGGDMEFSPQEKWREGTQVHLCLPGSQSAASNQSKGPAVCPGQPESRPAGLEQDQITREVTANPTESVLGNVDDGGVQEQEQENSPSPSLAAAPDAERRGGKPRLSLRRFFLAVGLSSGSAPLRRGRSSSAEQLAPPPETSAASPARPGPGRLRKSPSLQTLRLGSPFLQLKKSSSVQNLQSPKRKLDRSSAYTPGEEPCSPTLSRALGSALSVEDVGSPSALRSVGRVTRAFPDGTLLLELSRPPSGTFGFLISRGKGRPDSGVYVEAIGDTGAQKLYAGLLGVGDEIVEVNGEKVAGLSLDMVTRLMTQSSTTSVRVLRQRTPTAPR